MPSHWRMYRDHENKQSLQTDRPERQGDVTVSRADDAAVSREKEPIKTHSCRVFTQEITSDPADKNRGRIDKQYNTETHTKTHRVVFIPRTWAPIHIIRYV